MTSLTKNPQPLIKKFFSSADEKTGRSVWVLEQLSSATGGGAMALVRQPKTAGFRPKSRYNTIYSHTGSQSVNSAPTVASCTHHNAGIQ